VKKNLLGYCDKRLDFDIVFPPFFFQVLPCIGQLHDLCVSGQFNLPFIYSRYSHSPFLHEMSFYYVVCQHDELKPLTKTFTDSLSELVNLKVIILLLENFSDNGLQMDNLSIFVLFLA